MYDKSDPRSTLAASAAAAPAGGATADAEYGLFYKDPATEEDSNGKTWFCRGQNFIVAYTEAKPGATFPRTGQPDEYMALAPDRDTPLKLSAGRQQEQSDGYALVVLPPGDSSITLPKGGRLIRLFSTHAGDLAAKCANADSYARPHPNIPEFRPWPAPKDGFKIRVYSLEAPREPGRFGRIWRCTTLMVNIPEPNIGPRDLSKVSPHHHDDFEQGSLALAGVWQHHMRWPWSVDMKQWREDVHAEVDSPSITVIPPPAIHTSTWSSPDVNQLVDIFAPPRIDFSQKPGWVLNEAEYPMPSN